MRSLGQYVLAGCLGALLAKFAPSWLLLPAFLTCIATVAVLTVAAHTASKSERGPRMALVFVAVLLVPAGIESRSGPVPRIFIMSLLFTLGFVLLLALQPRGA